MISVYNIVGLRQQQQLEKKLKKSFSLEIPDFGSSNLKQSERKHILLLQSQILIHVNRLQAKRIGHTPSANGALVGSGISSSFLIDGKKPSKPDQQLAHSFSAPSSPSPDCVDMHTHDKVLASDLDLPMDMAHTCCLTSSNDVSLTWKQSIMCLPPKSHNSFPLHSSSTDAQLELLEELKLCKKNTQLNTVATLKTPAKIFQRNLKHTLSANMWLDFNMMTDIEG
ncbi:hypothetical protein BY996DRAFT_6537573 [Phakopsora pachyrhizi]|nr:hypothetical protein BY996DRAFT_6537573 [Phakopsora pachyrhizi]